MSASRAPENSGTATFVDVTCGLPFESRSMVIEIVREQVCSTQVREQFGSRFGSGFLMTMDNALFMMTSFAFYLHTRQGQKNGVIGGVASDSCRALNKSREFPRR